MKNLDFKIAGISIDVDKLFTGGVTILWKLLISTLVFYLVTHFGRKIIKRYLDKHNDKLVLSKRSQTISALVNSLFRYTMVFFYVYSILTILGIPVGTLIASAGIFSLAIGLGAQGFMSDLVNGFFILLEQQLDVGDLVQIDSIKGTVTAIGLRTTQLTGSDGTLTFIPNRNITTVQNFSRNNMASNVDIRISTETPLEKLVQVIKDTNDQLIPTTPELSAAPVIVGPLTSNGLLVFRVTVTTKNGAQGQVASKFLAAYLKALRKQQVPLAWEQAKR